MPEQARTRDCVVLVKGDTYPVVVSEPMVISGWRGGQGVRWVPSTRDEFSVGISDGYYAGFVLFGSDEDSDQYTSMTRNQPYYRFATACAGGWHILTTTFEKYTYASRVGPGPLVPIVYLASDRLVFSLRGYFTSEDEWTLSGDPRGSNSYYIAFVTQAPTSVTNYYLGLQVSI